jgi:hypothetical protein
MIRKLLFVFLICVPGYLHAACIYDCSWVKNNTAIYKTIGNRGQDIFSSSICPSVAYTLYPDNTNKYIGIKFTLNFSRDYSTLNITSKNKCFPSGNYKLLN